MNTKWFPLFGLVLGATEPDACDEKGLANRPPAGANVLDSTGEYHETPPPTGSSQTPTVSVTVGATGPSVTVTAPLPTP